MRRTAHTFVVTLAALLLPVVVGGCATPPKTTLKAELETPVATWIPTLHLSVEMTR